MAQSERRWATRRGEDRQNEERKKGQVEGELWGTLQGCIRPCPCWLLLPLPHIQHHPGWPHAPARSRPCAAVPPPRSPPAATAPPARQPSSTPRRRAGEAAGGWGTRRHASKGTHWHGLPLRLCCSATPHPPPTHTNTHTLVLTHTPCYERRSASTPPPPSAQRPRRAPPPPAAPPWCDRPLQPPTHAHTPLARCRGPPCSQSPLAPTLTLLLAPPPSAHTRTHAHKTAGHGL